MRLNEFKFENDIESKIDEFGILLENSWIEYSRF